MKCQLYAKVDDLPIGPVGTRCHREAAVTVTLDDGRPVGLCAECWAHVKDMAGIGGDLVRLEIGPPDRE